MIERPRTHNHEKAEETGNRYLANLGLKWDDLQGSKVLDIGASSGEFEYAARERGIEVVSIDKEPTHEYAPPSDSRFVAANATQLPFKDASFNFTLAHMSAMNYLEKGYAENEYALYLEDVLREAYRILQSNGEFRFTDTALEDEEVRLGEKDIVPDSKSGSYEVWRMNHEYVFLDEIAKRVGFRELKLGKYSDSGQARPKGDEHLTHYYSAIK